MTRLLGLALVLVPVLVACGITGEDPGAGGGGGGKADDQTPKLRIAQFNIRELTTAKLLDANHRQVKAATEIIARFDAEILSINEIQYDLAGVPTADLPGAAQRTLGSVAIDGEPAGNAARLAERIASVDPELDYKYSAMFLGNSGFAFSGNTGGHAELDMRGFGEFPGRFNSALLSKHPILADDVRAIHDYRWSALPGNSIDEIKTTLGIAIPDDFPLFEKALFIVPVDVDGNVIHFVLAHPVSAGFSAMNPYRNRDELRAIALFLSGELPGVEPLPDGAHFVVVGDLNADPEDGDGDRAGISALIEHPLVDAHFPIGRGGSEGTHPERNTFLSGCGRETGPIVTNPATKLQLQLDYLLTSATLGEPLASSVFWPHHVNDAASYELTCFASDHRYVWMDLPRLP
ncbi:MAG TPA: endonuclease/exonuclease/phosphatase family protein [Kofleriaceae bacterium]